MIDLQRALDLYTATWTEKDPAQRRDLVAELYSPTADYATAGNFYTRHDGIDTAVTRNWDAFIANGFTFEITDGAAAHHGAVRLPWRMLAPDGVTVAAAGMQFLIFDDNDRVQTDHQFITQAPPA